jgi:transketolase
MAAISNGMSYDGKFLPFFATFLAFSGYMRRYLKRFLSTTGNPFSSSNNFLL